MPSLGLEAMVAETRTMVSPCLAITAPPACRAKSPASKDILLPSSSISTRSIQIISKFLLTPDSQTGDDLLIPVGVFFF